MEEIKIERKEKPPFLWHGSITPDIRELEPRKRRTPGGENWEKADARVYASDLPAFSAAHSFSWGTIEGFDLSIEDGSKVIFSVPTQYKDRLNQKVYMYKIPSGDFVLATQEPSGHTFQTIKGVKPIETANFESVEDAIKHFGGIVNYI